MITFYNKGNLQITVCLKISWFYKYTKQWVNHHFDDIETITITTITWILNELYRSTIKTLHKPCRILTRTQQKPHKNLCGTPQEPCTNPSGSLPDPYRNPSGTLHEPEKGLIINVVIKSNQIKSIFFLKRLYRVYKYNNPILH